MVESFQPAAFTRAFSHFEPCRRLACTCCSARHSAISSDYFDLTHDRFRPVASSTPAWIAGNCTLQTTLRSDWPRLLSQLSTVGPGLMMSGNPAATLCSRHPYPMLHFAARTRAANSEAGLWLDHTALGAARVTHSRRGKTNFLNVEFADTAGRTVHRFDLTPDSNLEAFFHWMRLNQASAPHALLSGCAGTETTVEPVPPLAQPADSSLLVAVLTQCKRRAISIRATVLAGPVIQRVLFTPKSVQPVDDSLFASNEFAGLHLHRESITQLKITPPLGEKYFASPALHLDTTDGPSAVVLEMGNSAQAAEWNSVVHGLV